MRSRSNFRLISADLFFRTLLLALGICVFLPTGRAQLPPQNARKVPFGVPLDAKWFNGKWYRVFLETKKSRGVEVCSWHEARNRCRAMGGQLCVVPDATTWNFVKELAGQSQLWLGATDEARTGAWAWVDGTPLTFKAWLPTQPDNDGLQEHFLHTWRGGWNDCRDDGHHRNAALNIFVIGFICEWKDKAITKP